MDESTEHRNLPLITYNQPPEIGDPADGAFDFPATFVPAQLTSVLLFWFCAVRPMRANQINATSGQAFSQWIGIRCLVVNQSWWVLSWTSSRLTRHGNFIQRRFNQRDFTWCGRGNVHSQRNTLAVCHHHKLRTLSAFGLSDACAPFFAGENVPSANTSYQRSRCLKSSSARNARHTLSQIPCSSQSRNRRQQVLGEGNRLGRSFQRAPLRSTQRMPSKHGRFGIGRRPPLGESFASGSNGANFAHCLFVSSNSS